MQYLAEAYINGSGDHRPWNGYPIGRKGWLTIATGVISAGLYFLLYHYGADIRHLAEATNHGDKTYFLAPIAIAFIFSLVHGDFTGRFWDSIGLQAKH